jgi:hypothetical protein
MRLFVCALSLAGISTYGFSHHSSCSPLAGAEFASCGAHLADGLEMNLIISTPQVTTQTKSAILCFSEGKRLASVVAHWVEYLHDDYEGEIPSEPISRNIRYSTLPGTCSLLEDLNLDLTGEWAVNVRFSDQDGGTFLVEVE